MAISGAIAKAFKALKSSGMGEYAKEISRDTGKIAAHYGKRVDQAQGLLTGLPLRQLMSSPANLRAGIATAIPMGYFGYKFGEHAVVNPLIEAGQADPMEDFLQQTKDTYRAKQDSTRVRVQIEDMQRKTMQASMRLAALDPHLYNEIMAGRSLPKDAVVFGGQPRTDLMQELSMGIAQGQYEKPQSAQDELMKSLGV